MSWQSAQPTRATGSGVAAVAAGESHTCALTTEPTPGAGGGVKCWGDNGDGQLGNGTTMASSTPVDVCSDSSCTGSLSGIAATSDGYDYTCALTTGGGVKCWGSNIFGRLGNGTTTDSRTPVDVCSDSGCTGSLSGVAAVSAGGFRTCALTTEPTPGAGGGVKCWGEKTASGPSLTPVAVPGLTSGVAAVSTGVHHACALMTEPTPGAGGGVKCWGRNFEGQLGNGTTTDSSTPVDVCSDSGCTGSLLGVAAVSAADNHTCALTTEPTPGAGGGVKCWGGNSDGRLGNGTTTDSRTPVDVCSDSGCTGSLSGVAAVSAGLYHTCALTTGGGVKCWGSNFSGQLGNGTITGPELCSGIACSRTPAGVTGLTSGGAAVSAGGLHTCALTTGGGVKCWGSNIDGQLGDGQTCGTNICATAVDVTGLTGPVGGISRDLPLGAAPSSSNYSWLLTGGLAIATASAMMVGCGACYLRRRRMRYRAGSTWMTS